MKRFAPIAALTALSLVPCSHALAAPSHHEVVGKVAAMVGDGEAQSLVSGHGLRVLNVLWEDTGRSKGSSVGPNISDVTIEVQSEDSRGRLRRALMPVIRYPNFHDKTGDIKMDSFYIRVGNEKEGRKLRTIKLKDFLRHPTRYMSLPGKGRIKGGSLLAQRDSHVLVSAQAAFLPIRTTGKTRFWPVIFNYQSTRNHPAVLTLLVTRQGTSMTIIDNSRDTVSGGSWGQRLYFNAHGERAPLIAERLSAVKKSGVTANGEAASSLGADANLLMLIQVPLKVKRVRRPYATMGAGGAPAGDVMMESAPAPAKRRSRGGETSDVEQAVLGHGQAEGPYTELAGLTIERDERFPVRVTVQFYQATSNGVLSEGNVSTLAGQIKKVYDQADYVGSLVVPGDTGRPTEWTGAGDRPAIPAPGHYPWHFPGLVERCIRDGKPCRPGPDPEPTGIVGVTR